MSPAAPPVFVDDTGRRRALTRRGVRVLVVGFAGYLALLAAGFAGDPHLGPLGLPTFGLPEVRWGIFPGAGGTQRLPRTVSLAKAMEIILMAKTLTAAEALEAGLINAVVPAGELMATAGKWAETICDRGPLAVRAAKEAILRGLTMPLADGLRLEAFLSGTLRGTEDAVEGPKAFAEKRKPNFQAR